MHVQDSNIRYEAVFIQNCCLLNWILYVVYIYAHNISQVMIVCTSKVTFESAPCGFAIREIEQLERIMAHIKEMYYFTHKIAQ